MWDRALCAGMKVRPGTLIVIRWLSRFYIHIMRLVRGGKKCEAKVTSEIKIEVTESELLARFSAASPATSSTLSLSK